MAEGLGHPSSVRTCRSPLQGKLQEIAASIRGPAYLPERMFPQLRERIGPVLDIVVEFSTLGEYRLDADGALCPASALIPASRKRPESLDAQRWAPEREPQMGGAGAPNAARAAVRRIVAGEAAGITPRRPGPRPACAPRPRRAVCEAEATAAHEQLCLAV
jgi:hypothetical protein